MNDGILNGLHRDFEEVGVCGIGVMHVDLPSLCPIQGAKLGGKIFSRCIVVPWWPIVIREILRDRLFGKFVLKKVDLVEK